MYNTVLTVDSVSLRRLSRMYNTVLTVDSKLEFSRLGELSLPKVVGARDGSICRGLVISWVSGIITKTAVSCLLGLRV
jgi:hypothetical protein